jgi:hypothetical protein
MKTLKLTIAAVILACTFQAASAQVRVGVRIGTPPPRRVIVQQYPVYNPYYQEDEYERYPVQREVIVDREPEREVYYRHGYYRRPMYFHNDYHRHERFERRRW